MKKLFNIAKTLLVLVTLLSAAALRADEAPQFSFSVESFHAVKGATVDVPVYFNSNVETTSLQVDIRIPEALVGKVDFAAFDDGTYAQWNTDRFNDVYVSIPNSNVTTSYKGEYQVLRTVVINSQLTQKGGIKASSDVDSDLLFTFRLKANDNISSRESDQNLNFFDGVTVNVTRDVKNDSYNFGFPGAEDSENVTTEETPSVVLLPEVEPVGVLTISEESLEIVPGGDAVAITLNYASDYDTHNFQFDVTLPAGLDVDGEKGNAEFNTDRVNKYNFQGFTSVGDNQYRALMVSYSADPSIKQGEGEIMKFYVKADDTFNGGDIVISKVIGSKYGYLDPIKSADAKVSTDTGNDAVIEADAEAIKALQDAFDAATAEIAENYAPIGEAAVAESKEAIQGKITALSEAAAAEAERVAEGGAYQAQATEEAVAELEAEIAAYVEAAKNAQTAADNNAQDAEALKDANDKAIAADQEAVAALEQALADAQTAAGENGDVEVAAEIAQQIADLKDSVSQAASNIPEGSAYVSPVELVEEEIAEQISQYQAAAAAAADVRAANKVTYDNILLDIKDVEDTYAAAMKKIESDYASSLETEAVQKAKAEVDQAIADAKDAVKAAYDTANAAPETFSYRFNAGPINILINDLLSKAQNNGVGVITVDTVVEGAIYTLDGVRHAYPVQGKINIIRTKDSSIKVFVK
jgi:hypothetical protein